MNMKMNFSMDEIRLKVEEYIKKGSRAAGRPVLTAYYVLTADSTPESERTNIMIAANPFPTIKTCPKRSSIPAGNTMATKAIMIFVLSLSGVESAVRT